MAWGGGGPEEKWGAVHEEIGQKVGIGVARTPSSVQVRVRSVVMSAAGMQA